MNGLTRSFVMMISLVMFNTMVESLSTLTIDQTKQGISAGKAMVEFVSQTEFSNSLTRVTTSIGSYLGAVGPFIGFVLSLVPSQSPELTYMKQMMRNIDNRFDEVDYSFKEIERKIDWSSVRVSFGQMEAKIRAMSIEVKHLYEVPRSAFQNRKAIFIQKYHSDYQNSGTKLYNAVTQNQGVFQQNLCAAAMKYTENDRKKTQEFMIGILKLLIKASRIELVYLRAQNYIDNESYMVTEWESRFQRVKNIFENVDSTVKNKYHDQSGFDTKKYAANYWYQSNEDFATTLSEMLEAKYYWRDWIVVVYNELRGYDNHCVSVCGGHVFFRRNGRNILVASVDENKHTMDMGRAERAIENVSVSTWRRGWWSNPGHSKKKTAEEVYDSLDYKYAACSVGVIKRGSNLWFLVHSSRFKYASKNYYNVFMWG